MEEKKEIVKKPKKILQIKCSKSVKVAFMLFILILTSVLVTIWLYPLAFDITGEKNVVSEGESKIIVKSEENIVTEVVAKSMDAVVSIAVSKVEFAPDQGIVDSFSNIGSGFIVDPSGMIITNQHVVSDESSDYQVITNDGREYPVVKILHDDINDIALLKIEAENLVALPLGNSDNLLPGQLVIAIGTPLGEYAGSVTTGVISGLNRSVSATAQGFWGMAKTYEDVIQTDAAVNPGNSGGPLLNSSGEVIGVNFATTSVADNISFALPVNNVKNRIDEYRKYGKFLKPYLGIEYQMISESQARYYENVVAGALIRRIVPESPAEDAGLERLDIIMEIGGKSVVDSFASVIQEYGVGEEIELKVYRDGEELTLKATLGEMD
jgi:serine protease Do